MQAGRAISSRQYCHHNSCAGIIDGYQTFAENNMAQRPALIRIVRNRAVSGGEVRGNIVFDNFNYGLNGCGTFISNRVYDNVAAGISVGGASNVVGNQVYDNAVGIQGSSINNNGGRLSPTTWSTRIQR